MFSATIPAPVERLARRYLRDAVRITIDPQQVTVPEIEQVAYEVGGTDKLDALARVLDVETPGSAIVFCGTRRMVDDVADRLQVRGYRAAPLHGDMAQAERERVLRRFRDGQTEVLVATDVAARGLDIEGVTHVVNFDVPWDPEQYVHRIGRTGRAGRTGDAITLVTPRDYRLLRTIERLLGNRVERKRLPSLADLAARRREATKEAVTATVAGGGLDPYLVLAGELGDDLDPVEVAAAALRLWDEARTGAQEETTLAGVLRAAAAEEQALQARRSVSEAEAGGQAPEAGMRRIFVAAGRADGLRPQDLVGAIANETGLPGRAVGAIDILDRFSFVEVPSREALRVVDALKGTTLRGRRVGAHLADESDERGGRGGWVQRDDRGRQQRDERGPRPREGAGPGPRDGAGPGPRGGPPDRDAPRPPSRDPGAGCRAGLWARRPPGAAPPPAGEPLRRPARAPPPSRTTHLPHPAPPPLRRRLTAPFRGQGSAQRAGGLEAQPGAVKTGGGGARPPTRRNVSSGDAVNAAPRRPPAGIEGAACGPLAAGRNGRARAQRAPRAARLPKATAPAHHRAPRRPAARSARSARSAPSGLRVRVAAAWEREPGPVTRLQLRLIQRHPKSPQTVLQLLRPAGPHDGAGHRRLRQHPGQRDVGEGLAPRGEVGPQRIHGVEDGLVPVAPAVHLAPPRVGEAGAPGAPPWWPGTSR